MKDNRFPWIPEGWGLKVDKNHPYLETCLGQRRELYVDELDKYDEYIKECVENIIKESDWYLYQYKRDGLEYLKNKKTGEIKEIRYDSLSRFINDEARIKTRQAAEENIQKQLKSGILSDGAKQLLELRNKETYRINLDGKEKETK